MGTPNLKRHAYDTFACRFRLYGRVVRVSVPSTCPDKGILGDFAYLSRMVSVRTVSVTVPVTFESV